MSPFAICNFACQSSALEERSKVKAADLWTHPQPWLVVSDYLALPSYVNWKAHLLVLSVLVNTCTFTKYNNCCFIMHSHLDINCCCHLSDTYHLLSLLLTVNGKEIAHDSINMPVYSYILQCFWKFIGSKRNKKLYDVPVPRTVTGVWKAGTLASAAGANTKPDDDGYYTFVVCVIQYITYAFSFLCIRKTSL